MLENGIPEGADLSVNHELTSTGSIDLNDANVAGYLSIANGGAGSILHGGNVIGRVQLCTWGTFSGTATFASIASGGTVDLEGLDIPAHLAGTIHAIGDVSGNIWVRRGDVLATGRILVDGTLHGQVTV